MKKGFTLIELLVVIAIIAILAAILFPVFAKAREKARQTTCTSNQKQIATAVMMYTQENDEIMPPATNWASEIGVTGKILQCPTAGKKISVAYGYNGTVAGKGLGQIQFPVDTICTIDAEGAPDDVITPSSVDSIARRHDGKAIVSFIDSHVALANSTVVGFPIVEMNPESVTTDLASLWSGTQGWRFYTTDAAAATGRTNNDPGTVLTATDNTFLTPGIESTIINLKGYDGHTALYTFTTPLNGDFAFAFNAKEGNAKHMVVFYDASGNVIFSWLRENGSNDPYVGVNPNGTSWVGNDNLYLLGTQGCSGEVRMTFTRSKGKMAVSWVGETNGSLTFPNNSPVSGTPQTLSRIGSDVKFIMVRSGMAGEIMPIGDAKILR